MLDVESHFEAFKATWGLKLLNVDSKQQWLEIPQREINKLGNNLYMLNVNIKSISELPQIKSLLVFYQEVIHVFAKSKVLNYEEFCSNILTQPLFGNRFIIHKHRGNMKPIYFKHWINSNIRYVRDLRIANGKVDTTYLYEKINVKNNILTEMKVFVSSINKHISGISLHEPGDNDTN